MVALSFKRRFVEPIQMGTKRQTVRAIRKDGRTAKPGDELQLYTAMRTKHCRLIGRSICLGVWPIQLWLGTTQAVLVDGADVVIDPEEFARADGFATWAELVAFWAEEHPNQHHFAGTVTRWGDLL
jgi:hypothetical protein